MQTFAKTLAVASLVALTAGPGLAGSHAPATEAVVMDHMRAIGALDVDAIVATYAEDAAFITADRVYAGAGEIREFYDGFVAEFSQPGISMETDAMMFAGNTFFNTWRAESPDNVYEFGADTIVVEDGKIISHTMAVVVTPK
jgi:ketosteroid isomerase-like protein